MASEIQSCQRASSIGTRQWSQFNSRRGTGQEPFAQRLARARLLFLRRRELAADWLALVVVLCFCAVLGWTNVAQVAPLDDGPLRFEVAAEPLGLAASDVVVARVRRPGLEPSRETAVANTTKQVMS
ncbi:MAG TPA: hypothetical protein VIH25_10495 [Steroidobacteraceae bacterium]